MTTNRPYIKKTQRMTDSQNNTQDNLKFSSDKLYELEEYLSKMDVSNNYIYYIDMKFNDEFNINSTIKLSLKTKKLLDEVNEKNQSYEDLIVKLIKENNFLKSQVNQIKEKNNINFNLNSYQRTEKVFDYILAKVKYSINKFSPLDDEFQYSITILTPVIDGKKIDLKKFYLMNYVFSQENIQKFTKEEGEIIGECMIYFLILFEQIKNDFNIKTKLNTSLITKLEYWEYFFSKMDLTKGVYEKDILEPIHKFRTKLKLEKKLKNLVIQIDPNKDYFEKLKKLKDENKK